MDKKAACKAIRNGNGWFLRRITGSRKVWLVILDQKIWEVIYNKNTKTIDDYRDASHMEVPDPRFEGKEQKRLSVSINTPCELPLFKPVIVGWLPLPPGRPPKIKELNPKEDFARRVGIGSRVQKVMRQIIKRDGPNCVYCLRKTYLPIYALMPKATIDHVIPKSKGGKDHIDNFVLACSDCNQAKADKDPDQWMREIWGPNLENCPHEL